MVIGSVLQGGARRDWCLAEGNGTFRIGIGALPWFAESWPMNWSCWHVSEARMSNRPATSGKQAKGFREPDLGPLVEGVSRFPRRCKHVVRLVHALPSAGARSRLGGKLG